ncbi:hypothetical protein AAVH_14958 [Aphelenchoides avenae]|nr:hypothetical protein AAVH_14958 [Aphelenchus avenae]
MGKHFTTPQKKIIVNAVRAGLSLRNVQELHGVPKSTVQRWIAKMDNLGSVKRLPGSGRKSKVSKLNLRRVVRAVRDDPSTPARTLANNTVPDVSPRTLRRHL